MTDTERAPISAGWYPDPRDAEQRRWWDGAAWTHAVMRATPGSSEPVFPTRRQLRARPDGGDDAALEQLAPPGTTTEVLAGSRPTTPSDPAPAPTQPPPLVDPQPPETRAITRITLEQTALEQAAASAPVSARAVADETPPVMSETALTRESALIGLTPRVAPPIAEDRPRAFSGTLWLIVATPFVLLAVTMLVAAAVAGYTAVIAVTAALLCLAVELLLAVRDRRRLRETGASAVASPWWMLLTPVAYLAARGARSEGTPQGRFLPLLVTLVLAAAAIAALALTPLSGVLAR